jgi:hypothetical protein
MKPLFEIFEALIANPMILILSAVAFVEHVGIVLNHKLRPAKRAMVMIMVGIVRIAMVAAMSQHNTLEVFLLPR